MRVAHGLDEIGGLAAGHVARPAQNPLEGVLEQILGVAVPAAEMPRDPRQALHVRGQALGVEGAGQTARVDMTAMVRFARTSAQRGSTPDFLVLQRLCMMRGCCCPYHGGECCPHPRPWAARTLPGSSSIARGAARGRCPDRPSKPGGPCDHGWKVRLLRRSVVAVLSAL